MINKNTAEHRNETPTPMPSPTSTHNTSSEDSTASSNSYSALSHEDIAKLKKAQKRNTIIAILLGILLMISGFYAGKAIKSYKNSAWNLQEICVVYHQNFNA